MEEPPAVRKSKRKITKKLRGDEEPAKKTPKIKPKKGKIRSPPASVRVNKKTSISPPVQAKASPKKKGKVIPSCEDEGKKDGSKEKLSSSIKPEPEDPCKLFHVMPYISKII